MAILTSVTATLGTARSQSGQRTLAITDVHVVDVRTGRVDSNRTILIAGSTITGVVARGREPAGSARIDEFSGAYIIPGLWDMHTHLARSGRSTLALYVALGITGVRDMGGDFSLVRAWADSVRSGTLPGPAILVGSPVVERASWIAAVKRYAVDSGDTSLARDMDSRIPISTPEDAIRAVDSIVAMRADFLKIRNDAAPATTFALLRRARERGLPVTGHWPSRLLPATAAESGYASLEHGPLTVVDRALTPTFDRLTPDERTALFALMARTRTAYAPTITALKGFRLTPDSAIARILADTNGSIDQRMRYVPSPMIVDWKEGFAAKVIETGREDWAAFQRSWLRDIRPMANAGVLLLAGTDVGSPLVFPAFSLADELEALVVEAGLTPLQSLQTATLNVATWSRQSASAGFVGEGARADLVLLSANPLDDIRNVRRIRGVVRRGQLLNRASLDSLLARATQRRPRTTPPAHP